MTSEWHGVICCDYWKRKDCKELQWLHIQKFFTNEVYVYTCRSYFEQINGCILSSISVYSKLRSLVSWQFIYYNKKRDLLLLDPLDLMLLLPETFFKFSFYQLSLMAPLVNLMKPLQ